MRSNLVKEKKKAEASLLLPAWLQLCHGGRGREPDGGAAADPHHGMPHTHSYSSSWHHDTPSSSRESQKTNIKSVWENVGSWGVRTLCLHLQTVQGESRRGPGGSHTPDLLKVLNPSGSKYWDIVFFCQRVNTNWSRLLISSLPLSLLRELLWLVLLLLFFCWYIPFALDFSYIFFSDNWFYSSAEGFLKKHQDEYIILQTPDILLLQKDLTNSISSSRQLDLI